MTHFNSQQAPQFEVIEFIGVYDADSTIIGEISYWIGARLGRTHCSLCEITHGMFTVKSEWKQCERSLRIPFVTFHRNDAPADVLAMASGQFPLVLKRTETDLSVVLRRDELENLNGSATRLADALSQHIPTA